MDREPSPWDLAAKDVLRKFRVPGQLELDRTGQLLRDATGAATVRDAVLACVERAVAHADPRLWTIFLRCDAAGEPMKVVAADLHVSLRHFFRYRVALVGALAAEIARVLDRTLVLPRDATRAQAFRELALAQFLERRARPGDEMRALAAAERALRLDPYASDAWCVIAMSHVAAGLRSVVDPDVAFDRAARALAEARELAPQSGLVRGSTAAYTWWACDDDTAARRFAEEAAASTQGSARAHYALGWIAATAGDFETSDREFGAAIAADPASWFLHQAAMATLFLRGEYARCAERCAELHAIEPSDPYVLGYYAEALNALGRYDDTIAVAAAAPPEARGNFAVAAAVARAHALRGERAYATQLALGFDGPPVAVAAIALGLGDVDRALRALERAREVRNGMLLLVPFDPVFQVLRDEPRFRRIVARE